MEYQSSVLTPDIGYVMDNPDHNPYVFWTAEVIAVGQEARMSVLKLVTMDVIENYSTGFAETITIDIVMGAGSYSKVLYPNSKDLEVVLTRFDPDDTHSVETFKAYLISGANPVVDTETISNIGQHVLDVSNVVQVRLQLVNKAMEQLRLVTVGGVYRQTDVGSLIRSLMTKAMGEIDVDDEDMPEGLELLGEYNDTVYEQIIIPHGTALTDLPGYLQEKQFGVYSTGLGHFYKNGFWYVYPVYDTDVFNQSKHTLEIIVVPQNQFPGLTNTYRTRGSNTTVLATGPRLMDQGPVHEQIDKGEGTRFADATNMILDFVDTLKDDNKAIASRGKSNTEVINETEQFQFHNAPVTGSVITSNKYKELTKLAARDGLYYTCVWEYSDPELLYPGMGVRVKYLDDEVVRVFEGVVVGSTHNVHLAGTGITANNHYTVSALTMFVTKDLDIETED